MSIILKIDAPLPAAEVRKPDLVQAGAAGVGLHELPIDQSGAQY
jgi:hypothetical protein